MFVGISNAPRDYSWGSHGAISELLGAPPTDAIEAELWLGAHPGSPSRVDGEGAESLIEWIAADPKRALGGHTQLPYLLKVLAAGAPLSLQAHPTLERAREGFDRENALGIPLDAPHRNYKDPLHKPEVIVALSDQFDALCGFRPIEQSRALSVELVRWAELSGADAAPFAQFAQFFETESDGSVQLQQAVEFLLNAGPDVATLVAATTAVLGQVDYAESRFAPSYATAEKLAAAYPGDPGIVTSLLLNRVTLSAGQALYLPAGNIHAYLDGLGIELMAASDNVLRGGLTPKHVDVAELLEVLEFEPVPIPYLVPRELSLGVQEFRPGIADFVLHRIDLLTDERATLEIAGAAIILCTAGAVEIHGDESRCEIEQGMSVFVTPAERALSFTGQGTLYVASPGRAVQQLG